MFNRRKFGSNFISEILLFILGAAVLVLLVASVYFSAKANAEHDCDAPTMAYDRRCTGAWTNDRGARGYHPNE